MSTKEIVESYYDGVARNNGWQASVSDNMKFISPGANTNGKAPYFEATSRFLGIVKDVKVKDLIIEGDKACALVDYRIVSPNGDLGNCFVAEFLSTKDGKIDSSTIFFDTAAFRAFYGSPKISPIPTSA
jgi:ketosteroid isomerase-like protein